jgi:molybdopterin synthase catalytic subunit
LFEDKPRASRGVPNLNAGTDVPLSFTAFGRVIKAPAMRVIVYSVAGRIGIDFLTIYIYSVFWNYVLLRRASHMGLMTLIDKVKSHPDYANVGMILCHNGVVRGTSGDGRRVSGLTLTVDGEALNAILAEQRQRTGIVEILVQIRHGSLKVGDDVMFIVVAGDFRDHVIPVLEDTLNAIKKRVTHKVEHFLQSGVLE